MGSSEVFRVNRNYSIPERIDLGLLWWNMPSVVNSVVTIPDQKNSTKLLDLSKMYDSLSVSDYLMHKTTSATSEPVVKSWTTNLLDSIELTERKVDRHWFDVDVTADMTHALLNGHIEHYTDNCRLNLALPDSTHRKYVNFNTFKLFVVIINYLDGAPISTCATITSDKCCQRQVCWREAQWPWIIYRLCEICSGLKKDGRSPIRNVEIGLGTILGNLTWILSQPYARRLVIF